MKILYIEDNPIIALHIQQMVEDLGHVFVGPLDSFLQLKENFDSLEVDGALVDIDLADGHTGPKAAAWLNERGVPSIFVTGQKAVADQHRHVSLGVLEKPVSEEALLDKLDLFG